MKKSGIAGLILLFCLAGQVFGQRPEWVSRRPRIAGYYIGIGVALRGADPAEARDRATHNALNDIATQLEVRISSTTGVEESEDAAGLRQAYRSQIETLVSTELAGVEIADTWEGEGEVWVYARLAEEKFAALRQEKIERARRLAFSLVEQAEARLPEAAAEALVFYLEALGAVAEGLGDPLRVEHQGRRLELETAVPARIRDLLAAITLEAGTVPGGLKHGAAIDAPLTVRALYGRAAAPAQPVARLPLTAFFVHGEGQVATPGRTRADGRAVARLTRIAVPASVQTIRIQVDLEALAIAGQAAIPLSGFAAPFVDIPLTVGRQQVFVQSRELNLGQPLEVALLEPAIKRLLNARGAVFADRPEEADVLLLIEAQTRQGNRVQNIHFAFLDLTLASRRKDGVEIFKTGLNNVKGAGASFQLAGVKAFEQAIQELGKGTLTEVFDQL